VRLGSTLYEQGAAPLGLLERWRTWGDRFAAVLIPTRQWGSWGEPRVWWTRIGEAVLASCARVLLVARVGRPLKLLVWGSWRGEESEPGLAQKPRALLPHVRAVLAPALGKSPYHASVDLWPEGGREIVMHLRGSDTELNYGDISDVPVTIQTPLLAIEAKAHYVRSRWLIAPGSPVTIGPLRGALDDTARAKARLMSRGTLEGPNMPWSMTITEQAEEPAG